MKIRRGEPSCFHIRASLVLLAGLVPLFQASSAASRVIRVPGEVAGLHEAVIAAAPFDTILVAPGTYDNVSIVIPYSQRGIVLTSEKGSHETILNAVSGGRLITFDEADTMTELSGFTLRGGNPNFDGGAVYAYRSQILISNCEFVSNTTQGDGGAVALYETWALLWRNVITANAARQGGGVYASGSTVTLAGNTFRNNRASQDGGGLLALNSAPGVDGNVFDGNVADRDGGGVAFFSPQGEFRNNVFRRNRARRGGGFVCTGGFQPDLTTNVFSENDPADISGCSSGSVRN